MINHDCHKRLHERNLQERGTEQNKFLKMARNAEWNGTLPELPASSMNSSGAADLACDLLND